MRQSRLSGSVEGVMGNHDSYSDKRLWRPHQKIANSSCVSMTSQRATDTNQELRNIPVKVQYEKTRHIETRDGGPLYC
jgi:hypothetical protein